MSEYFTAAAIFELAVPVERVPADLRLYSLDWGVLFSVTGRHTVAQIGTGLGLAPAERDAAFSRLLALGLLSERLLSAGEYLRAASTVGGEPRTLAGFLTAGLAGPPAEAPAAPPAETPADPPAVPSPATGASVAEPDSEGFEPLPLPEPETAMPIRPPRSASPLSLRAVMRFVVAQARDADAGQLDVYRTFVRLDPQLLKRNGITTLRFEEDRLLTDPDLQRALLQSVEHVVGRSCPPDVFVHG